MANLDRLKGTPYLIDGFESFLREWFHLSEPDVSPLPFDEATMKLFREMPAGVLQFHEVLHRWSASRITVRRRRRERRFCKPVAFDWTYDETKERWRTVPIVEQIQPQSCLIYMALAPQRMYGQLYYEVDTWGDDETISVAVEDLLIGEALAEIISMGRECEPPDEATQREGVLVFECAWNEGQMTSYFYHPEKEILWSTWHSEDLLSYCRRPPKKRKAKAARK